MPRSPEHKAKADEALAFLRSLRGSTPPPAWVAVLAFYAALHLVERLFACESVHNDRHTERLQRLRAHRAHRVISAHFDALYDNSLTARYGTVRQFERAMPGDAAWTELVDVHLAAIEQHVDNHFKSLSTSAPT